MKISVSILDAVNRYEAVEKLNDTNISYIHIDVMDGKLVNNIQFQDMDEIREISKISKFPLQVHLMVEDASYYVSKFASLNIESITIHLNIKNDIHSVIKEIHNMGYLAGIAGSGEEDILKIIPYLNDIDMILVMSVVPGRGGQAFISNTSDKIRYLRNYIIKNHLSSVIEVDGGINDKTIKNIDGADIAVVGSYIIKASDYDKQIKSLEQ